MIARTRIALLAFAGVLAGTAPAAAAPPDFTPSTNPAVVGYATAQLGLACSKCAAQIACSTMPLYQEITAVIERFTPQTAGTSVAPLVAAMKGVSSVMLEIQFKKPDPNR